MKWAFSIRNPYKAALILAAIMVTVITFELVMRMIVANMNRSMVSLHNDRLVPASDIFHITSLLYSKRLAMENELASAPKAGSEIAMAALDKRVDALMSHYEKTYLVNREKKLLAELKQQLATLRAHENAALAFHLREPGLAKQHYGDQAAPAWQKATETLSKLHDLQASVGAELLKSSGSMFSFSELLSYTGMIIAIVLGCLVIALVKQAGLVQSTQTNYHLN